MDPKNIDVYSLYKNRVAVSSQFSDFSYAAREIAADLRITEEAAMSFLAFNESHLTRKLLLEVSERQEQILRKLDR